jgi:hypothetical protein
MMPLGLISLTRQSYFDAKVSDQVLHRALRVEGMTAGGLKTFCLATSSKVIRRQRP